ncbi:MAG: hypothetical protein WKF84_27975 [Pyrinomonadaceae bacterium]
MTTCLTWWRPSSHNGVPLSDNVNANGVPVRNQFPFVAEPMPPSPPGQNRMIERALTDYATRALINPC